MQKHFLLLMLSTIVCNYSYSQVEDKTIYSIVEAMPVFSKKCASSEDPNKCTMSSIQKYAASIDYPMALVNNDIQGKVYVKFIVNGEGDIIDVILIRGTNKLLDALAINHIKKMPSFYKPGYQRGKTVKVQYIIPINFKLSDDDVYYSKKTLKKFKKQLKAYELEFKKNNN